MIRLALPLCTLVAALLCFGSAKADDDPLPKMRISGALAAARVIVAERFCPTLHINRAKLNHFLELDDQSVNDALVQADVTNVTMQYQVKSQYDRIALCLEAFDKYGTYQSGMLDRGY